MARNRVVVGLSAVLLLVCLAAVTGCRGKAPIPPALGNPDLALSLALSPQPVRQLDPISLTVHARDASGRPVAGAQVTAELSMPGMEMDHTKVALSQMAPGDYSGVGRFTMPGQWLVLVTAQRGTARAVLPVTVTVK